MKKIEKLTLNKETLRILDPREAESVDGAMIVGWSYVICNNRGGSDGSCIGKTGVCW